MYYLCTDGWQMKKIFFSPTDYFYPFFLELMEVVSFQMTMSPIYRAWEVIEWFDEYDNQLNTYGRFWIVLANYFHHYQNTNWGNTVSLGWMECHPYSWVPKTYRNYVKTLKLYWWLEVTLYYDTFCWFFL